MYLLKAKKRVVQGPQPTTEPAPVLPLCNDRYKNRQPQIDTNGRLPGIIKHCKYMATFKVENGLSGQEKAILIKQYLQPLMAKYKSKAWKDYKLVALQMLDQGVKVLNKELKCVLMAHNLSRISYSVADPNDGLLAFVARSPASINSPAQTYCHAFVFDNRREAAEINTTLGNAFRLAYCKRTLKRPIPSAKANSHHTHSSSSTGTTDSDAILRKKRHQVQGQQQRPENFHHHHHQQAQQQPPQRPVPIKPRSPVSAPNCTNAKSPPVDLRALQDTDINSRIENWLDGSTSPPALNQQQQRWKRSGSCQPNALSEHQLENLRRPSRVANDQMTIPPEIKDQFWFQGGIPRHIALECLLHECEGAFIVRMSQTQKGCYALSLRGATGTYHYLIYHNSDGFYFPGSGRVFADLESLIHHHCYEQEGLACKLTLNRNNPLYKDDPDSSDFEDDLEDPDYEQPPEDGFTTLLPSKHSSPVH